MLDEKICELRQKLNDSILKGQDYNVTYKLSVELDELIAQYYRINLEDRDKKEDTKNNKLEESYKM